MTPIKQPIDILPPQLIMAIVCRVTGQMHADFVGTGRHHSTVRARRVWVRLCREWTNASYPELAALVGGKCHSSLIQRMNDLDREIARGDLPHIEAYRACTEEVAKWVRRHGSVDHKEVAA